MPKCFESFTASKQHIELQNHTGASECFRKTFDIGTIHSGEVICYYADSGLPVGYLEIIRSPDRGEPAYLLCCGELDEVERGDVGLQRLERLLYDFVKCR